MQLNPESEGSPTDFHQVEGPDSVPGTVAVHCNPIGLEEEVI